MASIELQVCSMVKHKRKTFPRMGAKKLFFLLQHELAQLPCSIGRDKFISILRKHHLLVKKRKNYHTTTMSKHRFYKHPNLIKDLIIHKPEQVWVSDITYIKTEQGHNYLHLVTDAYSKQIMGYELSDNLKAESSLKALKMAISNRKHQHNNIIHHSDRGFQYCSGLYTNHLSKHGFKISMTEKYDPYENAIAERVNGILKDEFDLLNGFKNHLQAVKEVKKSIQLYNQERPHLSCGMLTPEQAHNTTKKLKKLWKNKSYYSISNIN